MRATAKRTLASVPRSRSADQLELYRRIFAESVDGIAIIDPSGRYIKQNRAHEFLTGYSDDELEGQTPAIHLGHENFEAIATALQQQGHFRGVLPSHNKHGQLLYLDLSAFSVVNEAGEVTCFVGIKRDITDRRRAEDDRDARIRELEAVYALARALNQAIRIEDIYHAAIEAVVSALGVDRASILIFDDAGVMRFKSWRGLSDAYRAAVEGHSPWAPDTVNPAPVTVPDVFTDAALSSFSQVFAAEGIRALAFIPVVYEDCLLGKFMLYFNYPHRFTDAELRVAQALAAPVAIALERRRAEDALRRSEQLAAAGRLAASIAHEINNPLAAITNLVFLLRSRPNDPVAQKYLADLDTELRRVSLITRQTLGFYRDTAQLTSVDICALLQDSLAVYVPRLESRGIAVKLDCSPASVHASAGEIRQVVSNIIANAADALRENETLTISGNVSGDHVEITIADTGHGMPQDVLSHIFEPFFTTRKNGGTGLGLWITRQLVEKNGGTIRIESATGVRHGTTVHLTFPRSDG